MKNELQNLKTYVTKEQFDLLEIQGKKFLEASSKYEQWSAITESMKILKMKDPWYERLHWGFLGWWYKVTKA
jgi:hypothetical protein